jgi:hypothetical protein
LARSNRRNRVAVLFMEKTPRCFAQVTRCIGIFAIFSSSILKSWFHTEAQRHGEILSLVQPLCISVPLCEI